MIVHYLKQLGKVIGLLVAIETVLWMGVNMPMPVSLFAVVFGVSTMVGFVKANF